ncbi:MAG: DUF2066 domain-containing protein [Woeseiaceae bacterium]
MKSYRPELAGRCRHAVLLAALMLSLPLGAVEVPTLYTADVPLDSRAGDPRANAYRAALVEVLLRVSGPELANDREMVETLFPNPSAYVTQFRPGEEDSLWVSFDGDAIERVLRNAGQSVWSADRPLTLVWLAVDWGQGDREIIGADDPERTEQEARSIDRNRMLRERLLEIAEHRGLPLIFPLLDTEDLQRVTFADIWGGFDEAVLAASGRYDASSILIGRIRPGSSQRNRWTYHFGDNGVPLTGSPEAALGQVADRLAAEFAVGGDLRLATVALEVAGIDSVDAYGNVQQILGEIALIDRFAITEVAGDRVRYRVDVRGGPERLARALRFNGLLEQDLPGSRRPEDALEFYYAP